MKRTCSTGSRTRTWTGRRCSALAGTSSDTRPASWSSTPWTPDCEGRRPTPVGRPSSQFLAGDPIQLLPLETALHARHHRLHHRAEVARTRGDRFPHVAAHLRLVELRRKVCAQNLRLLLLTRRQLLSSSLAHLLRGLTPAFDRRPEQSFDLGIVRLLAQLDLAVADFGQEGGQYQRAQLLTRSTRGVEVLADALFQ